ncbi:MAG TPA: single-stranded-DNA-specific exonuclease RecJ [Candidatus Absconditabacterales bacterium]|nr:single-stranded-DNA-specific exonuclease RecJ [Candidatus Absconditabacterales bacterium]
MKYKILCEDKNLDLIERIFKIRGISDDIDNFLNPKIKNYRLDPLKLNDMQKAVNRIIKAIEKNEKIMIFGDYDADGVTSSFILFKFFAKYLKYKNISIMYPDRIEDGYGLKNKHLDSIKEKGVDLIITVDNGITSVLEAEYAKEIGIDLIITDHHKNGEQIPDAIAVVNPVISKDYDFKYLAGVGVAFKLICALLDQIGIFNGDDTLEENGNKKNKIFNYFLPIVAIGTVADIVPLIGENRLLVKKGLDLINNNRHLISESLQGFLKYLNLKEVDTFHIGFVIGPRINAGGRISSPYKSLDTLLFTGAKQLKSLQEIDEINTNRKKLQESAFKIAEESLNLEDKLLIAESEDFHEGIVGIVSGRITEKYNKPSIVFKINKEKGIAVASLRGPEYFDIIDMIQKHGNLLERSGGHKHAGGLTVKIEKLKDLKEKLIKYSNEIILEDDLEKTILVDTHITHDEWNYDLMKLLQDLGPFGEGNKEPNFLFKDILVDKVEKVGKNGNGHMKICGNFGDKKINFLFWGKGDMIKSVDKKSNIDIVGKIKKDDFNGGYFVNGVEII